MTLEFLKLSWVREYNVFGGLSGLGELVENMIIFNTVSFFY